MHTNEIEASYFIDTLSEKGKRIVNEYLPKFQRKHSFDVIVSDVSKVLYSDKDKYRIFVKSGNASDIEYNFMHEFFHCVQHEDRFPSLHSFDTEHFEQVCRISSYILDYNIRYFLEKYSYYNHRLEIKKLHDELTRFFSDMMRMNFLRKS